MRIVYSEAELEEAYNRARSEAMQSFGDDELYVEKIPTKSWHIGKSRSWGQIWQYLAFV